MNFEQVQVFMAALVCDMMEKGVITPKAKFVVRANEPMQVVLESKYGSKCLGGDWLQLFSGSSPDEVITAARDFIASLDTPETKVMKTYLAKLADAVDYGHSNGIAAEYVDPVRITQKAMSENLLAAPSPAEAAL